MSVAQLSQYIGQNYIYKVESISFNCTVKDVKISYGQVRFLIAPVDGNGFIWVNANI
jgi:hypothetical protein